MINATVIRDDLRLSLPTVYKLVGQFESIGLLEEVTGAQRNRRFRYAPYLALFEDHDHPHDVTTTGTPVQSTESGSSSGS